MMPSRPLFSVLLLFIINTVYSEKLCVLQNTDCITKAADVVLKAFVPGIEGVVESSDPLHLPNFEGEMPGLKYEIINGTLSGLSSCHFSTLKMNGDDFSYKSEMLCDQLIMKHYFKAHGMFGPVELDGIGFLDLKLNNYLIKFKGEYGIITSENDHQKHYIVKSSHSDFETKGEVTVNVLKELHTDKVKSELARNYVLEHPYVIEKEAREPVLKKYMTMFIKNLDTYTKAVPAGQVLPVKV